MTWTGVLLTATVLFPLLLAGARVLWPGFRVSTSIGASALEWTHTHGEGALPWFGDPYPEMGTIAQPARPRCSSSHGAPGQGPPPPLARVLGRWPVSH